MNKSREFNNVLDECLERLLVKGETIEQCLQSFPEYEETLKPLLETALTLKKGAAIQPSPELRDKIRYHLYSAPQKITSKRGFSFSGWNWQPRWVMVVAVVLAFLLAGGGTAAAASGSMPDEPLYPVKLATEQVQLVLTPSALGKAELYDKMADRRVGEIIRMADKNKPEPIERASRHLNAYLMRISDLASTQREALPAKEMPAAKVAPMLSQQARESQGRPMIPNHRARLRTMVMEHATNHPAQLRALLEKAPPSVRPALLQAIAISESGYKKALEQLDQP